MDLKSLLRKFAVAGLWFVSLAVPTRVVAVQADIEAAPSRLEVMLASNDLGAREKALAELVATTPQSLEIMMNLMNSVNEAVRTQSYIAVRVSGLRGDRILQSLFKGLDRVASMPGWTFVQDLDEGYELARAIHSMGKSGYDKALENIANPRPAARATAALAVYIFLENQFLENQEIDDPLGRGERRQFTLPDRTVEVLIEFVDDDYPPMRVASILCLIFANLEGEAKTSFIRALAPRFRESESRILLPALEAVKFIKPAHPEFVTPLIKAFGNNDDRDWIQSQVADTIAFMGEAAESAAPYLISQFQTGNANVRANSLIALTGIGRRSPGVSELMRSAQHDPDERVRELAAKALGSGE